MTRLGARRLDRLKALGSPSSLMPVPGATERGGLLVEHPVYGPPQSGRSLCGPVGISAAGLRRLADEMDAGRVKTEPQWFARQAAERSAD